MATRAVLFLGAFCYGVGLLIVNLHYAQFGTSEYELAQAQYVVVGAVWLTLILLGCLWSHLVHEEINELRASWHGKTWARRLAVVCYIVVLAFSLVPSSAFLFGKGAFGMRHFYAVIIIIGTGTLATQLVQRVRSALSRRQIVTSQAWFTILFPTFYKSRVNLQTPIPVLLLALYANFVYGELAPTFSGGQPRQAILLPTPEQLQPLKSLLEIPHTESKTIGPIEILGEGSSYYLIRSNADPKIRSTRVKKDHISAVRYLK